MLFSRRAPLIATAALMASAALVGCVTTTPGATPAATSPAVATPAATVAAATPSPTVAHTPAVTATPVATTAPSASATTQPSTGTVTTPVPGSSLDVTLSDAGVAGRITIPDDTRNDYTGTHEIIGLAADSSNCGYSLEGDEFTAVAWFDDAPNGMLHQLSVSVAADQVPANDGEQRTAISDGSVYADFVSESGFGTAYGGATSKADGSSSSIDAVLNGDTLAFTFTATTGDGIDFSGQLMCAGMGGE